MRSCTSKNKAIVLREKRVTTCSWSKVPLSNGGSYTGRGGMAQRLQQCSWCIEWSWVFTVYWLVFILILKYGHELWVVHRVYGRSLRDRVLCLVTQEESCGLSPWREASGGGLGISSWGSVLGKSHWETVTGPTQEEELELLNCWKKKKKELLKS